MCQHCSTSLNQDLVLSKCRHFSSHISVTNARFGSRQIFYHNTKVVNCVFKTVLNSTESSTLFRNCTDCCFNCCNSSISSSFISTSYCNTVNRQTSSRHILEGYRNGSVSICTNLEFNLSTKGITRSRIPQQLNTVEVYCFRDVINFTDQFLNFQLDLITVSAVISTVSGLVSQRIDTLQHGVNFSQSTLSCLDQGNTVLSVALCLGQAVDLETHFLRDCQTSCIVSCTINAVTGRQFFHCLTHLCVVEVQVAVSVQCANVSVNKHSHRNHPP
ncbi:hypothetical protein D3C78_1142950 [compost metagenome]